MGLLAGAADLVGAKGLAEDIRSIETPSERATRQVDIQQGGLDIRKAESKENIKISKVNRSLKIINNPNQADSTVIEGFKILYDSMGIPLPDNVTIEQLKPSITTTKKMQNIIDAGEQDTAEGRKTLSALSFQLQTELGNTNEAAKIAIDTVNNAEERAVQNAAAEVAQLMQSGDTSTKAAQRIKQLTNKFGARIGSIATQLIQSGQSGLSVGTRDELAANKSTVVRGALDRANISKGRVAAAGATQVNLGKSTKSQLEKDIIEGDATISAFDDMEKSFKPEFLTFGGKAKAGTQRFVDKLGFDTDTEFLEARAAWFSQTIDAFIRYRKWATGVAGGKEELQQIAKARPNPEENSPAEFMAILKGSRKMARKLLIRKKMFLVAGIENPTPEEFASISLDTIPDEPEEQNIDVLDEDAEIQRLIDEANRNN